MYTYTYTRPVIRWRFFKSEISASSGSRRTRLVIYHRRFSQDWRKAKHQSSEWHIPSIVGFCIPGNNTLSFFRICRTEVCYLSSFELCKGRLPSKRSKEMNRMIITLRSFNLSSLKTHSWTALAESVVLNLAKVFTYSRVLLYALQTIALL